MAAFTEAFTGDTTADRERSGSVRARELAPRGQASRDRPSDRGGELASISPRSRAREGDLRGGDLSGDRTNIGVVIPSDFNAVRVVVTDPEGNRLTDVDWIMARGSFPTAARVNDDAEADLWLLRTAYTDFMGVAHREGAPEVDYTWYSASDTQDEITGNDKTGVIVLERSELKGTLVGSGINSGGAFNA